MVGQHVYPHTCVSIHPGMRAHRHRNNMMPIPFGVGVIHDWFLSRCASGTVQPVACILRCPFSGTKALAILRVGRLSSRSCWSKHVPVCVSEGYAFQLFSSTYSMSPRLRSHSVHKLPLCEKVFGAASARGSCRRTCSAPSQELSM